MKGSLEAGLETAQQLSAVAGSLSGALGGIGVPGMSSSVTEADGKCT